MTRIRSILALVLLALALAPLAALAQAERAKAQPANVTSAAALWEDFVHYLRVANVDLAVSSGNALLDAQLTPDELLAIVDDISPYRDYATTLDRGQRLAGEVSDVARRVAQRIEDARHALARDDDRIRANIEALDQGLRARVNAQQRLKSAGEHAAPQMLQVLLGLNEHDRQLRPYVLDAMVFVGLPIVAPLCEALPQLPPIAKQQAAEVLARIGYPLALPFLRAELDNQDLDVNTRRVLQVAFDAIASRASVPANARPADLFLVVAEDYYRNRSTLVLNPDASHNLMWTYESGSGLHYHAVPTAIFGDVMAMRLARRALEHDRELAAAMSLWIAANFRRENNIPAGETDPSYGPDMRSPHYYATLAGPRHLHAVLARALADADSALALDAISALYSTSGTRSLINADADTQPLLSALAHADRRVRFEAAFTIARSVPRVEFAGSHRVVPVLAQAIRDTGRHFALVIAPEADALNRTVAAIESAGSFESVRANTVAAALGQVALIPGVDVIVINVPAKNVEVEVAAVRRNAKMAGSAILVIVPADEAPVLSRTLSNFDNIVVTDAQEGDRLAEAIKLATESSSGAPLDDEQATRYAQTALAILHDLSVEGGSVFRAVDASPALVLGLKDARPEVALGSAEVLARIADADLQQALAEAALDSQRDAEVQIPMLRALARSARSSANHLSAFQLTRLAELVRSATGELADAAAEVHGALNLPTSDAVDQVLAR